MPSYADASKKVKLMAIVGRHSSSIYSFANFIPIIVDSQLDVVEMSAGTKRTLRRSTDVRPASPKPASKRLKTSATSHVPAKNGLAFLVNEDARAGKQLTAHLTNGVPRSKTARVDESQAVVIDHAEEEEDDARTRPDRDHISISSGVSDSSEYESENDGAVEAETGTRLTNGHAASEDAQPGAEDEEMEDAPMNGTVEEHADEEHEEPSFGDLLRARHMAPIDVQASLPAHMTEQAAVIPASSNRALGLPASTSLFTFLSQSLKTNDQEQLERCFQVKDLNSVRATIQRLPSHLVATLLKRIAERIHKRPGRMAQLMVWVRWSLVTHGGYLAGQPDVTKSLKALSQVVRERAAGLQPLLHVKGKLDMLSSQLVARRSFQAASRGLRADEDDDEGAVTYVEGTRDDWSDSDGGENMEGHADVKMIEPLESSSTKRLATQNAEDLESEEDGMEEITVNGVAHDLDDDEEEASEVEGVANGMFDVEAEETSNDEEDEENDSNGAEDSDAGSEPSELSEDDDGDLSDHMLVKSAPLKTLDRKR